MTNRALRVMVSEEDRELIETVCKARGENLSGFIRRALRRELATLNYYDSSVKKALGLGLGDRDGY
jgi:hypothetical protein